MLFKKKEVKKKRRKLTPAKKEQNELDAIWKKKVKDRDNWTCQVCRKKLEPRSCHAHHILPKHLKGKRVGLRWDVDNGIALCPYHHKLGPYAAHQNSVWFTYWLKTNKSAQFKHVVERLKMIGEVLE